MKKLALCFLAFLVIFAFSSAYAAEKGDKPSPGEKTPVAKKADKDDVNKNIVGKVSKVTGTENELTRAGEKLTVTLNMKVHVLDSLVVADKGVVEITMFNTPGNENDIKNATKLTFAENTKATIQKRKKEANGDTTTKIEVEKGKLSSDVKDGRKPKWKERRARQQSGKKTTRTKSNYEISTPTAIAGARGTQFIVAVTPSKTFVYVKSGEVWVKDRVKGDIRTLKRKRLLEIGITGFGIEIKVEDIEQDAMESSEFSSSFNPISTKKRMDDAKNNTDDKSTPDNAVEQDVADKMDNTKGTADSQTPDAVEPGGSVAPSTTPDGGSELPDPPPPPGPR